MSTNQLFSLNFADAILFNNFCTPLLKFGPTSSELVTKADARGKISNQSESSKKSDIRVVKECTISEDIIYYSDLAIYTLLYLTP